MQENHYNNLEDKFQKRNTLLQTLLDTDNDDEDHLLYPAWESLQKGGSRYGQKRFIAEGGEKRIDAVFDSLAQREVAMATSKRQTTAEKERFLKEARLTAFLEHPNIMPVYDIGLAEEAPYFTMELIKGKSLAHKRGKGPLNQNQLEGFLVNFIRVCDAVAYAHSKEIIHLDIKPANIQIGQFGEVLLCDWGLAKVIGDTSENEIPEQLDSSLTRDLTVCGKMRGTPGYMSPALANGEKGSPSDDIYSLGATLYFVLTGECPHNSEKVEDIIKKSKEQQLSHFAHKYPNHLVPRSLEAVAIKALSKESYSDVQSLQKDVTAFLRGYATDAEEAGFLKILSLLYKRQKTLCNLIAASLLIIITSTTFFIQSLNEEKEKEAIARQEAEESREMFKNELRFNQLLMEGLDLSLQGIIKELEKENLPVNIQEILVKVGRGNINQQSYEAATQMLESLAQQTSGQARYDALHDLAFIRIFTHDFAGALKILKTLPDKELQRADIYEFIPLCKEFMTKPKHNGMLSLGEFKNFISKVSVPRKWFFPHAFSNYLRKTHSETKVEELLTFIFRWWDNSQNPKTILKNGKLSFSNINYMNPVLMEPIFKELEAEAIDFANTRVKGLLFIKNCSFKEVSVANSAVSDLRPLLKMPNIKQVTIQKGQSYTGLKALRKRQIKIIER
ncbi:MAG: serine/threonine protein kinase [Lentisphaerales bacterium]|nr:serine/threonine protein kinase [Lentisphaerales bacterium]